MLPITCPKEFFPVLIFDRVSLLIPHRNKHSEKSCKEKNEREARQARKKNHYLGAILLACFPKDSGNLWLFLVRVDDNSPFPE